MTDDAPGQESQASLDLRIDGVRAIVGGGPGEQFDVLDDVRIGVRDGHIVSITPMAAAPADATATIDGAGAAVFPGLFCTHDHVFQNLLKGLGDELGRPCGESEVLAEQTPVERAGKRRLREALLWDPVIERNELWVVPGV